jgi:hypothetical protein
VHAAGVLGDVATDGAGDLARRVGRVVQAVRRGRFADGQVAHAALHHGGPAHRVHLENAVELRQAQRDPHGVRHGATRQPGAGTTRHHRHVQAMAGFQHRLHLLIRLGQGHHQRALAVGGQAIAFVGGGVFGRVEDGVGGQHGLQRGNHGLLSRGALRAA